ncbi:MAG: sensor histidine kinase KdpD [Synechococcaceae cyanobacterium SM2_3_2]|nr:sensor histidine kinase KdpD [Synechococcaceae cyanobacterium SM2_3_2]
MYNPDHDLAKNSSSPETPPLNNGIYPYRRGKHKIFIGMAPGVGKTYRMLSEARQLKADGIDVVVGVLETHGRAETAFQAEGLKIIPRKQVTWHGVTLTEMDPDAIIARQPQLVLVDELAHTNAPGSFHQKRYQDVEQILAAGIDVHSTVNIQHLESLNDLVARITGVIVRERIPDKLFEDADEVLVVDVTPETLEERLRYGKIYALNKVDQALTHFFQRRNLIALRELALREVADNIEEDIADTSSLTVQERLIVCVSTYPNSLQLIRRGSRLASYLNAKLYGLFVANLDRFLSKDETLHIETCERLIQEFGGEFVKIAGSNVAEAIARTAEQCKITQVVIGESPKKVSWTSFLDLRTSMIRKLIQRLNGVDIHIISVDKSPPNS